MKNFFSKLWPHIGWFLIGLMSIYTVFGLQKADAVDNVVVSVYADSYSRLAKISGGTVSEVLDGMGVKLYEGDLVEPGLESKVVGPVFNINVFRARPVLIEEASGTKEVIHSPYSSARVVAEKAGFEIYNEDIVKMEIIKNPVASGVVGEKLVIDRALPVELSIYGTLTTIRTHAETVGQLLAEKGVEVKNGDEIVPSPSTKLANGMFVKLVQEGAEVINEQEVARFATRTIYDKTLAFGHTVVEQEGRDGIRIVTYRVSYQNSQESSRQVINTIVTTEPLEQVVRIGTKVVDGSDNKVLGQAMVSTRGWGDDQWVCLLNLWIKESQWNHLAENPYSGAYGIPQSLPGSKMASHGSDWRTNPRTQIAWGLDYIAGRYSTPCGAWNFFLSHNWY